MIDSGQWWKMNIDIDIGGQWTMGENGQWWTVENGGHCTMVINEQLWTMDNHSQ